MRENEEVCVSAETVVITPTTERCPHVNECANLQTQDDEHEPSTYQPGTRYRVSDLPSPSTTDAGQYLEIIDTATYLQNVATSSPDQQQLEFIGDDDDDDYDEPESPYDRLDSSAIIAQTTPPTQPVYDTLTQ